MISQGEICWAELSPARRSEPGFRRPVLVVKSDAFNRSRIAMVVCVLLTSKVKWALMSGNVTLCAKVTGLPKNSVENVSQIVTVGRSILPERVGRLASSKLELLISGIEVVLAGKA